MTSTLRRETAAQTSWYLMIKQEQAMILEPWTAKAWQLVRDAAKFTKAQAGVSGMLLNIGLRSAGGRFKIILLPWGTGSAPNYFKLLLD